MARALGQRNGSFRAFLLCLALNAQACGRLGYERVVPLSADHGATTLNLAIGSQLNQVREDESWGINNLLVLVR